MQPCWWWWWCGGEAKLDGFVFVARRRHSSVSEKPYGTITLGLLYRDISSPGSVAADADHVRARGQLTFTPLWLQHTTRAIESCSRCPERGFGGLAETPRLLERKNSTVSYSTGLPTSFTWYCARPLSQCSHACIPCGNEEVTWPKPSIIQLPVVL